MFELPEYLTLASQMGGTIVGRRIRKGALGNSPHKFVWYNRSAGEFTSLTSGLVIGTPYVRGRWLFLPAEPGFVIVLGECGGKILFHESETTIPQKYHLLLSFEDGSALSVFTQMWGAMQLYEKGKEAEAPYVHDMRPTPVDDKFTVGYFKSLITESTRDKKRSVKSILTQDQLVPGLGNAIAQDIMFRARLNPCKALTDLNDGQIERLYRAIVETVRDIAAKGGRSDEFNLFGEHGGYVRIMDRNAMGKPCPECGTLVVKIQYLGGACYYCPRCQTDGDRQ